MKATVVRGPYSSARWFRMPLLTPPHLSSWVPLPHTVISRYAPDETNRLHILHELAHVYQIERDGWLRSLVVTIRSIFTPRKKRPLEIEASELASDWYWKEQQ